jgi:hypothetical protein
MKLSWPFPQKEVKVKNDKRAVISHVHPGFPALEFKEGPMDGAGTIRSERQGFRN